MKYLPVILLLAICKLQGQPHFQRVDTIKVSSYGTLLKNPWAGGLNFTQWSNVDIDLDGYKDLAVFDRSGDIMRIFKNDGIPGIASYTHAFRFQSVIPAAANSWALFNDYNMDGKADLYTYALGLGSVRVYRNTSTPGNAQLTYLKSHLMSDYPNDGLPPTGTAANSMMVPAISDIDSDGDLDIITFQTGLPFFEYHKNNSIEQGFGTDSLNFDVVDWCWGDASQGGCTSNLNYPTCPTFRVHYDTLQSGQTVMDGGASLLCLDMDGDTDKDILLSDPQCDSIEYFRNGGTISNAHFDMMTKIFPDALHTIAFKQFPSAYYLDIDNDGVRDLIAAPNIVSSENYKSVWYYKNSGADNYPNFQFVQKNFLQEQMLDFGEGAFPCAFDYDSDGDMDLLVGNFGYYAPVSAYFGKLALLENTGTNANPKYNLINADYAGLSSYNLHNITPAIGDLDADGDADLIVGDASGRMNYFENTAPLGSPANFAFSSNFYTNGGILEGIDVGINAYPQLFDVNNDGLLDLLVGEYEGWLNYFENRGTASSPVFDQQVSHFGNVHTVMPGYFEGQSAPAMFRENGTTKVLVGSDRGYLYLYGNIDGNLGGNFTLIDSVYDDIREGENIAPCLYDFDSDGLLDLVTGNYSGGLAYYKGAANPTAVEENKAVYSDLVLFPNPAKDVLNIRFNNFNNIKKTITVYDALGRQLLQTTTGETTYELKLDALQNGFYILETVSVIPNGMAYKSSKSFVKQ
jgi:hypothetical protein